MEVIQNQHSEILPLEFPRVTFGLDEEFDARKINDFIARDTHPGGSSFQQRIFRQHSSLQGVENLPPNERKARIAEYVEGTYQRNQERFVQLVPEIDEKWSDYAQIFFKEVDKIFKGVTWPQGEYKGLLSISQPYPRYLDQKIFQVPIGPQEQWLEVTAHEMLHFIFFEYVRLRYTPQLSNTEEGEMNRLLKGKFKVPLWELSEVFNTALLTTERFGEGGSEEHRPYPALVDHFKTVQNVWQESGEDIDLFFSKLEN